MSHQVREKLATLGALQGLETGDVRNRLGEQQISQRAELLPEELANLRGRTANAADQLALQQSIEQRSSGREPLVREGLEEGLLTSQQSRAQREVTNPLIADQLRGAIQAQIASTANRAISDPLQQEAIRLANEKASVGTAFDVAGAGQFPRLLNELQRRGIEGTEGFRRLSPEQYRSVTEKILDGMFDDPEVVGAASVDALVREFLQRAQGGRQ